MRDHFNVSVQRTDAVDAVGFMSLECASTCRETTHGMA